MEVQLAEVNSEAFQLKTKKQIDEAMAQISSPEFKRQIAEAERQAARMDSPEMQKRLAEAQAQVDAASRQLAEALASLEKARNSEPTQKK